MGDTREQALLSNVIFVPIVAPPKSTLTLNVPPSPIVKDSLVLNADSVVLVLNLTCENVLSVAPDAL